MEAGNSGDLELWSLGFQWATSLVDHRSRSRSAWRRVAIGGHSGATTRVPLVVVVEEGGEHCEVVVVEEGGGHCEGTGGSLEML